MKLSAILSNGMVLQRGAPVAIWGSAERSQSVQVVFMDNTYTTTADKDGSWRIALGELAPGGPYTMTISSGEETVVIDDILVGDVWVLGGQSNMELPITRTVELLGNEVRGVNLPQVRQFTVPQVYDFHGPRQDIEGGVWIKAVDDAVLKFSATGFFMARSLYEQYRVPIGLIMTAIGGTPVEAWTSEPSLRAIGGYDQQLDQNKNDRFVEQTIQSDAAREQAWHSDLNKRDLGLQDGWFSEGIDSSDWSVLAVPQSFAGTELEPLRGSVWFRTDVDVPGELAGAEALLKLGTIIDADQAYVNGELVGATGYRYPPRRYIVPAGVLKAGKNSIAVRVIMTHNTGEFVPDMPYELHVGDRVIDLQGNWQYRIGAVTETLVPQTFFQYMPSGVYNGMLAPLRQYAIKGAAWYQGESNAERAASYNRLFQAMVKDWRSSWGIGDFPFVYAQLPKYGSAEQTDWAELREQQRQGLSAPNTAMAVLIDCGEYNELHPQDKRTVGQRLALCARSIAYGEDIVYSGPLFQRAERIGKELHLHFDHVGSGLVARGGEPQAFEVSGADGCFVAATARLSGDTVVVSADGVDEPHHVRYAWSNNPTTANLYNREGLPASPFTAHVI